MTGNRLKIVADTYPNGDPYRRVMFDEHDIGSYSIEAGGFFPRGKRKARATEFDAVLDIVADRQKEAQRQVDWLQEARDAVFAQQRELKG